MNRIYVTAPPGKFYHEKDAVLTAYHEGKQFRVYQGHLCTKDDEFRMRMAGFTHICFLWQDRNHNTHHYDLELK